jgi:hypothetical protein
MFRSWRQRHLFRRLVAAEVPRGRAAIEQARRDIREIGKSFRLGLADLPGIPPRVRDVVGH